MPKKIFTPAQIKDITGASRHEKIGIPFYYAPPFLDGLQEWLTAHLASNGGRPTIKGSAIVRKIRLSKESWRALNHIAESWSQGGVTVSPAQVATSILEKVITANKATKAVGRR